MRIKNCPSTICRSPAVACEKSSCPTGSCAFDCKYRIGYSPHLLIKKTASPLFKPKSATWTASVHGLNTAAGISETVSAFFNSTEPLSPTEKYFQWLEGDASTDTVDALLGVCDEAVSAFCFVQAEKTSAAASGSANIDLRKSDRLNFNQSVFRQTGNFHSRAPRIISGTEYLAVHFVHFRKVVHIA